MHSRSAAMTQGVAASLGASSLFAVVFLVSGLVDASAEVIFAWRVVAILACYLPLLLWAGPRAAVGEYLQLLRARRSHACLLPALVLMVGIQLWLFVWAPANGKALDASLGFLLLPIALVLGGRFVFKSAVSAVQWASVALAVLALLLKLLLNPAFSWVTGFIALVYPAYFMIRRHTGLDHRAGFAVEIAVLTPLALAVLVFMPAPTGGTGQAWAIAAIAMCGALAMISYLGAARLLPLPLFGMLSYVEPLLLVAVALALGERLGPLDIAVYALLAAALLLLSGEGLASMRRPLRRR